MTKQVYTNDLRRHRLPNRRPAITETIEWNGQRWDLSAGPDPKTGTIREIFSAGSRQGATMGAILADVAILISIALQYGVPVGATLDWLEKITGGGS